MSPGPIPTSRSQSLASLSSLLPVLHSWPEEPPLNHTATRLRGSRPML